MQTCPKCGYERQPKDDLFPADSCPKCGVIYAKIKTTKPESANAGSLSDEADKSPPSKKIESDIPADNHADKIFNHLRDYFSPPKIVAFLARYLGSQVKAYLFLLALLCMIMFMFGQSPVGSLLFDTDDEITYAVQNGVCKDYRILFYTLVIGNTGNNTIPEAIFKLSNVAFSMQQVYFRVRNLDASSPRAFDPTVKILCGSNNTWLPCQNYKQPVMGFGAGPCTGLPILTFDCIEDMREESFVDPCMLEQIGEREYTGKARPPQRNQMTVQDDSGEWPVEHQAPAPPEAPECTTIIDIDNREFERSFMVENLAPGTYLEVGFVNYEGQTKGFSKDDFDVMSVYVDTNATVREGDPRLTAVGKLLKAIVNLF